MRRLFAPEFQEQNPALVAERKKRFLALNTDTFHDACAALAGLDIRDQLSKVIQTVLVLVGESDEATPSAMSVKLHAGLPNATLNILPGLAHVSQLQAPSTFMEAKQFAISSTSYNEIRLRILTVSSSVSSSGCPKIKGYSLSRDIRQSSLVANNLVRHTAPRILSMLFHYSNTIIMRLFNHSPSFNILKISGLSHN